MKAEDFLREVTAIPGVTGCENQAAAYIAEAFRPLADEVTVTPLNCVIAHKKGPGPKVLICAHLDEIGMMVSRIEKDGCLRMQSVGGVDPRVLPGMRVRVYGKNGLLPGVVGATPPHLLKEADRKSNYTFETLYVDLGMPYERVIEEVRVGDIVCFEARYVELKNGRVATKTADDRACVAIMYRAMQLLQDMKHEADLYFVATCQEEIGSYGALMSGYAVAPDFGVAFDVCHADTPGAPRPGCLQGAVPASLSGEKAGGRGQGKRREAADCHRPSRHGHRRGRAVRFPGGGALRAAFPAHQVYAYQRGNPRYAGPHRGRAAAGPLSGLGETGMGG